MELQSYRQSKLKESFAPSTNNWHQPNLSFMKHNLHPIVKSFHQIIENFVQLLCSTLSSLCHGLFELTQGGRTCLFDVFNLDSSIVDIQQDFFDHIKSDLALWLDALEFENILYCHEFNIFKISL